MKTLATPHKPTKTAGWLALAALLAGPAFPTIASAVVAEGGPAPVEAAAEVPAMKAYADPIVQTFIDAGARGMGVSGIPDIVPSPLRSLSTLALQDTAAAKEDLPAPFARL